LGSMISKYSVEIYMIHGNVVHKLILVPLLAVLAPEGMGTVLAFCMVSLAADIGLPLGIAFLEKYFAPLDFIFHPAKYLEKERFYQEL
ncbi:MAG: hypothetical protein K2N94_11810, partial [Lachnospiraceae bacterium]|nr:hypothetical protein [Lachnospiraceae bacterium]